jgi:hypothetical protein
VAGIKEAWRRKRGSPASYSHGLEAPQVRGFEGKRTGGGGDYGGIHVGAVGALEVREGVENVRSGGRGAGGWRST